MLAARAQPAGRPLAMPLVARQSTAVLLPQTPKASASAAQASAARVQAFEAAIGLDPWDVAAWDGRLREAVQEGNPGPIFERAIKQFPSSARIWTAYAEWSESQEGQEAALSVYDRCLQQVPSLDLWSSYLTFCKRNLPPEEVIRAYQRAVDLLGTDWRAGLLWAEYLALLKRCYNAQQRKENPDAEVSGKLLAEDPNPIEAARRALKPGLRRKPDQQPKPVEVPEHEFLKAVQVLKVDVQLLRSAFQRAAGSAHSVLDKLWIGYEQFEKSLGDPQMAQRLLREHMPRYIRGKASFKELQHLCSGIDHFAVALPLRPKNLAQQTRILEKWHGVLQYERTNPLRLAKHEVQPRVSLCYQQAALSCAFHAEIWHDFVTWLDICDQKQQATTCLQRAVERFLPQDLVLRLLLAQRHELAEVPPSKASLDLANVEYEKLLEDMPKPCPLALINKLAFLRRQRSADEFRDAFLEAAESSPHCTWEVYTFAALTEYHVFGNIEAAARVFRLGLERYGDREPSLLAAYVNFLMGANDLRGARAELSRGVLDRLHTGVRDRLANRVDPSIQDSLSFFWQKWARLERYFGDAAAVQRASSFRDEEYQNLQRDQEVEEDAVAETPVALGLSASIAEVEESFRFQHLVPQTSRVGRTQATPSLPQVLPKPAAAAPLATIGTAAMKAAGAAAVPAAAPAAESSSQTAPSALHRPKAPPAAASQAGSRTGGSMPDTAAQAAQQLARERPQTRSPPTQAGQPEPFSALSTTPVDQAIVDAAEENLRLATPTPASNLSVHIARPDVSKMLAFRPALDVVGRKRMAESAEKMRPDELAALPTMIPKCLQDLLAVLPSRPLKGAKPDIDYLLTVLQTTTIPQIPVSELDGAHCGGLRTAREEHVPLQLHLFTKDEVGMSDNGSFFSSRPTLVRERLQAKRQKVLDEQLMQP